MASTFGRLLGSALRAVARAALDGARTARGTGTGSRRTRDTRSSSGTTGPTPGAPPSTAGAYPGDFAGLVHAHYAPDLDGEADPGEIVWTWVPYEEDHTQGKDRPVLLVGHDGPWLLGLMLSSRDHDSVAGRRGEDWLDLGTGEWDAQRRPSEVRLDRVIRVDPAQVRREGAVLDRGRFDQVVGSLSTPGD